MEYVAILLVVGALLGVGAGAVPGVGERVVRTLRSGICIAGGDVCRDSDAAAAGLPPCVTRERSRRQDTTLDIAVVRFGGHGEWQLALRSDGQAVVTRLAENELGGAIGAGLSFSPAGLRAEATAALVAGYHGGRAWRFPDARSAAAFLERAMRDGAVQGARPPDVRWHELGGRAEAEAVVTLADLARTGLSAAADSALGLRSEGELRTVTLDLGIDDPHLATDLPGFPASPGPRRAWVAELTLDGGTARELALRTAARSGGRLEELSARLDLRDRRHLELAERVLRPGASAAGSVRELLARASSDGVVERDVYALSEQRRGFDIGGRLGMALGLEHHRISSERRLTDALAWVRGGPPQRRFDCLGV